MSYLEQPGLPGPFRNCRCDGLATVRAIDRRVVPFALLDRVLCIAPEIFGDVGIDLVATILLPHRDLNRLGTNSQQSPAPERRRLTLAFRPLLRLGRQQEETIGTILPLASLRRLLGG